MTDTDLLNVNVQHLDTVTSGLLPQVGPDMSKHHDIPSRHYMSPKADSPHTLVQKLSWSAIMSFFKLKVILLIEMKISIAQVHRMYIRRENT